MATDPPVIQQIVRNQQTTIKPPINVSISAVEDCWLYDRHGGRIPFKNVYKDKKTIIIFVRNFLCYTCKEYVEDLAKIPSSSLTDSGVRLVVIGQSSYSHIEPFCSLTGYHHEMYVDPERNIYKNLGMRRGEETTQSGSEVHFAHFDMNRMDHLPINWLLQLAGIQTVDFSGQPRVIDV